VDVCLPARSCLCFFQHVCQRVLLLVQAAFGTGILSYDSTRVLRRTDSKLKNTTGLHAVLTSVIALLTRMTGWAKIYDQQPSA